MTSPHSDALFDVPGVIRRGAQFSPCGTWRYLLTRSWGEPDLEGADIAVFVMLNPSTADTERDDPTITRCINRARAWGCTDLHVLNVYAYRTPDPDVMWTARARGVDIVGPDNDALLGRYIRAAALGPTVRLIAGWGARRDATARMTRLLGPVLSSCGFHALAVTKDGHPQHPLYVPMSAVPVPWVPPT